MTNFKTLDIRGESFFSSLELANEAFRGIKKNGILEVLVDKKRNLTDALKKWAATQGYKTSDMEDTRMVRIFIKKYSPKRRKPQ